VTPVRGSVLIVGICLTDQENNAATLAAEFACSVQWTVEQRWAAVGQTGPTHGLASVATSHIPSIAPKFTLLNRLLADAGDLKRFEYVIVCDDDVELPPEFLDNYLHWVRALDFALCQPARTHDSYVEHWFVEQRAGLTGRRTRFVEIGPLFSIRHDAVDLILPFDESSPMGWGYDFVWPRVLEDAGLKLGIIDATAIAHALRKPSAGYDKHLAFGQMKAYLRQRPHLSKHEAFTTIEEYAMPAHKDIGRERPLLLWRPMWRRVRPNGLG
jgi:hypothetical protein